MIKNDMIAVIAKYMEIDGSGLDIQITQTKENGMEIPALVANIPILQIKHMEAEG